MRLRGRTEIRIHAQVESKRAAPEPRTSARSEIRWLHLLRQPEHPEIERARRRFLADRHRQLDMIEIDDFTHDSTSLRLRVCLPRFRLFLAIERGHDETEEQLS